MQIERQVPYRVAGTEPDLQRRAAGIRQYWSSHTMIMSKYSYNHLPPLTYQTAFSSLPFHDSWAVRMPLEHWTSATNWGSIQFVMHTMVSLMSAPLHMQEIVWWSYTAYKLALCSPVRSRDWPILIKHVNYTCLAYCTVTWSNSTKKKREKKRKKLAKDNFLHHSHSRCTQNSSDLRLCKGLTTPNFTSQTHNTRRCQTISYEGLILQSMAQVGLDKSSPRLTLLWWACLAFCNAPPVSLQCWLGMVGECV